MITIKVDATQGQTRRGCWKPILKNFGNAIPAAAHCRKKKREEKEDTQGAAVDQSASLGSIYATRATQRTPIATTDLNHVEKVPAQQRVQEHRQGTQEHERLPRCSMRFTLPRHFLCQSAQTHDEMWVAGVLLHGAQLTVLSMNVVEERH